MRSAACMRQQHSLTQCVSVTYALFTCMFMLAHWAMAMRLCTCEMDIHHKVIKNRHFRLKCFALKTRQISCTKLIYFFVFARLQCAHLISEQKTVRECVRSCKVVERLMKNKIIKFMHMFVESICCEAASFDWCGNYRFDYKIYL